MRNNLYILIPAAGESRRFLDEGYINPKPLLSLQSKDGVKGRMLDFVIDSIMSDDPIIVALPQAAEDQYENDKRRIEIQYVEKTKGQADTIYQMVKELPESDSCLILDCDMVLQATDIDRIIEMIGIYDVSIAVTETFDPNASRIDQVPYPTRFVEKEPISQWGIVGARAFKRIGPLKNALKRIMDRCSTINREPYLSMAINHYPGIKFAHIVKNFVDLGTPERIKEAEWEIL